MCEERLKKKPKQTQKPQSFKRHDVALTFGFKLQYQFERNEIPMI